MRKNRITSTTNTEPNYAHYHVSLKILLKKGKEILMLTDKTGKCWDLPGGRIDDIEHDIPLTDILSREVGEELGKDIQYKLGAPLFQFRRHVESKGWHVFLTVYEAEYIGGSIELSFEHDEYRWINPKKFDFKEEDFCSHEEFIAFKKYFSKVA